MGMSASQARLLSLTARMHDIEYQAQEIQYAKLDLVNSKDDVYEEYLETLDSTKYQMSVLTVSGNQYQDITYTNMIMANTNAMHSMYTITNAKGQIILPEQITSKIGPLPNNDDFNDFPTEEEFLKVVAQNYLYLGRVDLSESDYISEMKKDGNYDYWRGIYHQIIGYNDENGIPIAGRGFSTISAQKAVDRTWLEESLNSGEVQLFKMSKEVTTINTDNKVNIFAETNLAEDTELREVANDELIHKATVKYEKAIKDIDAKETKLDLQLAQIDAQHNALKTEYDSVKQIVSKNIDRSFKSFNA